MALSADGNTAVVGARDDDTLLGAARVFVRNGGVWTQQGPRLIGSGPGLTPPYTVSVSLSADGNTAIYGAGGTQLVGAAWIFSRSDGAWTETARLVGSGAVGNSEQGWSVGLSADGNTAIVGGMADDQSTGAAWIFTRTAAGWSQQGPKLVGTGAVGKAQQGYSVALSGDGNTAIVGAFVDNSLKGAAWIWTRSNGVWTQQGQKLVGSTFQTYAGQGISVALSFDGNTAIIGAYLDEGGNGAAHVWTRNVGFWSERKKLVAPAGTPTGYSGWSVSLTADGSTALVGAPNASAGIGAAWIFTMSGGVWTLQPSGLVGTGVVGTSRQGRAVDLSADGTTAMIGGTGDNNDVGAAWVFSSVNAIVPALSLDKSSLVFGAVSNGAAFTTQTSAQTVRVTQAGAGVVTWTASSNVPWLTVSPTSGTGSATLTISTQFAPGLAASQSGAITLAPAGTTTGPLHLGVTLGVLQPAATMAPFGSFDTPIDGTTGVTGSIAVTGWALDDVEVTRVRILRDPVQGEPAGTLVYIGDVVQVDGARPDVQALLPSAPRNSRAGWGYLMLTNFLPALGNGTFRLYAVADDADGHSTVLGTKTITCTNSTATAPTGAIDTPAQGGVVSGIVTNFGWVISLTPHRADPPGGGTVQLVIDGAFHSAVPGSWTDRPDLTALFPEALYPGVMTALGVSVFDSSTLANGVHTLAWLVTDEAGSASGIGSRYFTVSNGNVVLDPVDRPAVAPASAVSMPGLLSLRGRRGFNPATPFQTYVSGDDRLTLQAEELDRIELQLGEAGADSYTGHLRTGDRLSPLPIGSTLDRSTGAFAWMPGVGFTGAYDFVFAQRSSAGGIVARRDVRIVLNPKGSNRVGPQTVIDTAPSVAGASFVVAGWAADLDAATDTGVDTVHVWAYSLDPQRPDPIWLGVASHGRARPDVAAVFGERFLRSGYGLEVQSLPPGTYDVAVFAYSTVAGGFTPAKTVRVTVR